MKAGDRAVGAKARNRDANFTDIPLGIVKTSPLDSILKSIERYNMKRKVTAERVLKAVKRDDYSGFCLACAAGASGCEPDMRKGKCESCGEFKVYGAEECLLMGVGI